MCSMYNVHTYVKYRSYIFVLVLQLPRGRRFAAVCCWLLRAVACSHGKGSRPSPQHGYIPTQHSLPPPPQQQRPAHPTPPPPSIVTLDPPPPLHRSLQPPNMDSWPNLYEYDGGIECRLLSLLHFFSKLDIQLLAYSIHAHNGYLVQFYCNICKH
jgi:hypothetical protein